MAEKIVNDCISRQAAIDAVKKNTFRLTFAEEQNCEGHLAWSANAVYSDVIEGALLELPSAQPETTERTTETAQNVSDRDLISRKAAIDAIRASTSKYTGFMEMEMYTDDDAVEAIEALPSAQPEIVRCKDCKHYGCILYSGTQFEYGKCFGHEESDYTFEVKPDDFCSRAERRTDG